MSIAADQLIGTEFLGYRIERVIGRGGMGSSTAPTTCG